MRITTYNGLAAAIFVAGLLVLNTAEAGSGHKAPPAPNYSCAGIENCNSQTDNSVQQGQGQEQSTNSRAVNNLGGDSDSSKYVAIQASPVYADVPGSLNVCALSESSAVGLGWNFISFASAKQTLNSLCIYEQQAQAAFDSCQFRTATALRYGIVRNAELAGIAGFVQEESNPYADGELYLWDRPVTRTSEPQDPTSMSDILREAGVDKPWERQSNYAIEECETIKTRYERGERGERGEKGEKGDKGDRGPRGRTGNKIVERVVAPSVCTVCSR